MRLSTTLLFSTLGLVAAPAQTWTSIATDPGGDSGGLDATALEYRYDELADQVWFRITCANLASYSSGPAADFSFQLPNGLDSMDPPGAHWTTPGTPVHKIGYVYADAGGMAPANYTFNTWAVYIEVASTNEQLCTDCISVVADVPANQLVYVFDRTDIITDTEMGGSSATLLAVVNVGHDVGWDDNVSSGASFTINLSTSIDEDVSAAYRARVGPNPTNGPVTIFPNARASLTNVELTDHAGKQVMSLRVSGSADGVSELDFSTEDPGIYMMELLYADGIRERHRVVLQ